MDIHILYNSEKDSFIYSTNTVEHLYYISVIVLSTDYTKINRIDKTSALSETNQGSSSQGSCEG